MMNKNEWKKVKLENCANITMGQSPNSSSYNTNGEGIPFYQGNADFGDLYPKLRYFCTEPTKIANENDLLLSVRAPIGKINIATTSCCIGRGLCSITPKENIIFQKYLYYILKFKEKEFNSIGTGTTFKAINKNQICETEFLLPNIEEQKKITLILENSEKLLKLKKQQLSEFDKLVKFQFLKIFGDPVTNSKNQKLILLENCISKKSDLVDGPFGSSINTKVDYTDTGDIPVIRTKNVDFMTFNPKDLKFITKEKYEQIKRSQILPDDIILTKVGTIGNVCIFPNIFSEGVLSTTGSCRIRVAAHKINNIFLGYYLLYYKEKLLKIASTGVQPFLNMTHIKNIQVFNIEIELQNKFADFVKQVDKSKVELQKSIDETQLLFDSLMDKYFG